MKLIVYMLAGVGIAALIGYFLNRKGRAERQRTERRAETLSAANVTNDITKVGKGGVLRMPPFGASKVPIETYVKTRHRYEADGDRWYELVCEHGRRELLVEWSREGGEVYVTAGFEDENPTLEDIGITEDALIKFDDDERGDFEWQGVRWNYVESSDSTSRTTAASARASTPGSSATPRRPAT